MKDEEIIEKINAYDNEQIGKGCRKVLAELRKDGRILNRNKLMSLLLKFLLHQTKGLTDLDNILKDLGAKEDERQD